MCVEEPSPSAHTLWPEPQLYPIGHQGSSQDSEAECPAPGQVPGTARRCRRRSRPKRPWPAGSCLRCPAQRPSVGSSHSQCPVGMWPRPLASPCGRCPLLGSGQGGLTYPPPPAPWQSSLLFLLCFFHLLSICRCLSFLFDTRSLRCYIARHRAGPWAPRGGRRVTGDPSSLARPRAAGHPPLLPGSSSPCKRHAEHCASPPESPGQGSVWGHRGSAGSGWVSIARPQR